MRLSAFRTASLFLMVLFAMAICPEQIWFGAPAKAAAQANSDDPFGDESPTVLRKSRQVPRQANSRTKIVASSPSPATTTLVDDKIRENLANPCDFNYNEMPFEGIRESLEERYGVNIVLTASASEDALTEDETFSSKLSGISLASGLRILLADKNATYVIQDGVIKIISLDEAHDEKWFARRMIDVSETLKLIRIAEKNRIGKPQSGQTVENVQDGAAVECLMLRR